MLSTGIVRSVKWAKVQFFSLPTEIFRKMSKDSLFSGLLWHSSCDHFLKSTLHLENKKYKRIYGETFTRPLVQQILFSDGSNLGQTLLFQKSNNKHKLETTEHFIPAASLLLQLNFGFQTAMFN